MRHLFFPSLIVAIAGLVLTGCVNMAHPAPPSATQGLALATQSSRRIKVATPRFQINRGSLELAGSVSKNTGSSTTAFSHLDVLFRDGTGQVLQAKPIRFTPQSVGHSHFGSQRAFYSLSLDALPAGTAQIEVRAHDADMKGTHAAPRS